MNGRKKNLAGTALLSLAFLFAAAASPLFALRGSGTFFWPDLAVPAAPSGGGGSDAAVIAGIENYAYLPRLAGAGANSWTWYDYFNKTRGVPDNNITMLLDAEVSADAFREAVARASARVGHDGTLWVVFIGYGYRGALLPHDARLNDRGFYAPSEPQKDVLASIPPALTAAAIFDACPPSEGAPASPAVPIPPAAPANKELKLAAPQAGPVVLAYGRDSGCALGGRLPGSARPALSYLALGAVRGWADGDRDKKITASEMAGLTERALAAAGTPREKLPFLSGNGATVLAISAGETGPDLSGSGGAAGPIVNPGLVFTPGLRPAVQNGMETRSWTRDTDWNKLSRMLAYASTDFEKKMLAAAFVKAYGTSPDEDPYVVFLLPFLDMALVPTGAFRMGSPDGEGEDDESPRREVYLDAFSIDKHEVTAGEYRVFCSLTGRAMPGQSVVDASSYPVVNVDWESAAAYCEWAGKRLPTEAEWEKAARGGAETKYSFGDDEKKLGEYAWFSGNSEGQAHPVGLKKPNQYGIYDMAGNVWEWVADRYLPGYYRTAPSENPKGPGTGAQRVQRGGSWNYFDVSARPGDRGSDLPSVKSARGGFRCAF